MGETFTGGSDPKAVRIMAFGDLFKAASHRMLGFAGLAIALGGLGGLIVMLNAKPEERLLPDPDLTPGSVVDVSLEEMCEPGYAARVRSVDSSERKQAFRMYGLSNVDRRDYELDHLIPVSLGGSNDIKNIWPESRITEPWNAEVKDTLEDVLHREVCAGRERLGNAQWAIRTHWIQAYRMYVGLEPERFVAHSRPGF